MKGSLKGSSRRCRVGGARAGYAYEAETEARFAKEYLKEVEHLNRLREDEHAMAVRMQPRQQRAQLVKLGGV